MSVTEDVIATLSEHNIVIRNLGATIRPRQGRPDYVLQVDPDDVPQAVAALVIAGGLLVRRAAPGFLYIWADVNDREPLLQPGH